MNTVRSKSAIFSNIRGRLESRIDLLTNFLPNSTNELFIGAITEEIHEQEKRHLAIQLAHSIEYCNGVDEEDLISLGIDDQFEPEDLNKYLDSGYLDERGKEWSTLRRDGERATVTVQLEVPDDETEIYEGTEVSTSPDNSGSYESFYLDVDGDGIITDDVPLEQRPSIMAIDGQTTVEVQAIAEDVGPEYNVPANSLNYLPTPPSYIYNIDNNVGASGGTVREQDSDLKYRIQSSLFRGGRGSTAKGVSIYLQEVVDGLNDVYLDEYPQYEPTYVDVVADGGLEEQIQDALEYAHPSGMNHVVRRPESYLVSVRADVLDSDGTVDESVVSNAVNSYIRSLGLGEDLYRSKMRSVIQNSHPSIENIETLEIRVVRIDNERHRFTSNTNQYPLRFGVRSNKFVQQELFRPNVSTYPIRITPVEPNSMVVRTRNYSSITEYSEGTDYERTENDEIEWLSGGSSPDSGQSFEIAYTFNTEVSGQDTQTYVTGSDQYTFQYGPAMGEDVYIVVDNGSSTDYYEVGEDFELIDITSDGYYNGIEFTPGGSVPSEGDTMDIRYDTPTTTVEDVRGTLNDRDYVFSEGYDTPIQSGDYDDTRPDATEYPFVQDITWNPNGNTPDVNTEFTVDYFVNCSIENELIVDQTKKISPDTDGIVINSYTEDEIYG